MQGHRHITRKQYAGNTDKAILRMVMVHNYDDVKRYLFIAHIHIEHIPWAILVQD